MKINVTEIKRDNERPNWCRRCAKASRLLFIFFFFLFFVNGNHQRNETQRKCDLRRRHTNTRHGQIEQKQQIYEIDTKEIIKPLEWRGGEKRKLFSKLMQRRLLEHDLKKAYLSRKTYGKVKKRNAKRNFPYLPWPSCRIQTKNTRLL